MSHNARVRADVTAWEAAIPLEPSELDALDEGQFASINGDDGGSWAPSEPIIIGGAGIEFTGAVPLGEDLSVPGTITVPSGGAIDVGAGGNINVEASGHVHIDGELHIEDGGRLIINDGAQTNELTGSEHTHSSGSTETHASGSTDTYESGSNLSLAGNVALTATGVMSEAPGATVTEGAAYLQTGIRTLYHEGRTCERVLPGYAGGYNYGADVADVVIIGPSSLGGNRVYTLKGPPTSVHGDKIRFVSFDITHYVTFNSSVDIYSPASMGTISNIQLQDLGGHVQSITFHFSDGAAGHPAEGWYVTAWSRYDAP